MKQFSIFCMFLGLFSFSKADVPTLDSTLNLNLNGKSITIVYPQNIPAGTDPNASINRPQRLNNEVTYEEAYAYCWQFSAKLPDVTMMTEIQTAFSQYPELYRTFLWPSNIFWTSEQYYPDEPDEEYNKYLAAQMRSALGKSHKQKTENLDKVTRNTSKVSNPLKWYEKMLKKYIKVFSTSDKGFTSYLESSQASVICVQ